MPYDSLSPPDTHHFRGLYAITPSTPTNSALLSEQVEQAILGGARIIQFRDKGRDPQRRLAQAGQLLALCRRHGVPLVINDDVELAAGVGADGVHLGDEDMPPDIARQRLGARAIIGVSCYNRLDRLEYADCLGADYAALGRFFPSSTKALAVPADPALLGRARTLSRLPLVAIGGITPENGGPLIKAGADMLAVIEAVFGKPDVRLACNAFSKLFTPEESP